ncbi:YncE family protein [Rhodococcus sp. ARC_M6]|uniref:YncE family protein n=1 Tax=Rhodococcus sp. ARC_M6 TaxID=2928852 RepID=UPI001FB273DD|nr:YncE family protein [Rhodococcus sp. ARC_M6]MCJ0907469.1 hypothetical protein [Rhodococcus sp. ARC_M6]
MKLSAVVPVLAVAVLASGCGSSVPADDHSEQIASVEVSQAPAPGPAVVQTKTARTVFTPSSRTSPVEISPGSITVDPTTNRVYVGSSSQGWITVLDPTTLAPVASISIPPKPTDPGLIESPRRPDVMAISPATRTLYATGLSDEVTVVDLDTNTFTSTIETGGRLESITVDPEAGRVYAADRKGRVVVIDDRTHTVIGNIPIPPSSSNSPSELEGVAVDPKTHLVYAVGPGRSGPTVWTLDPVQSAVVSSATVGGGPQQVAVAVNPATNVAYVANYADGTLVAVDSAASTLATTYAGPGPTDIAVDAAGNFIYLGGGNNESITVVDGRSSAQVSTFRTGQNPAGLAVDPNTRALFVIDGLDHTISRWDPTSAVPPDVSESSSAPAGAQDSLTEALSKFLPAGYDPAVLVEKLAETGYGPSLCSNLEDRMRYLVSGSGQILMSVYGEGIARSIGSQQLGTFVRILVENYCPENLSLISE